MLKSFNPDKIRVVGWIVLLTVAFSLMVVALNDSDGSSMIWRGDFPGFFVIGEIVLRGAGESLYSIPLQEQIEREAWSSMANTVLLSLYPPFFALFCAPFSLFGPYVGKVLFSFSNLIALLVAIRLLTRGQKGISYSDGVLASLLFSPLFISVVGGQNTAFTLLLLILTSVSLVDRREAVAGFCVSLLFYKPQFGLMLAVPLCLILTSRFRIALFSSLLVLVLLDLVIAGANWPSQWLELARYFAPQNFRINGAMMTSLSSFGVFLGKLLGIAWVSLLFNVSALAIYLMLIMSVFRKCRSGEFSSSQALLFLGGALPFLSPQTLFYDLGLMIPFCLTTTASLRAKIAVLFTVSLLTLFAMQLRDYNWPVFPIIGTLILFGLLRHFMNSIGVPKRNRLNIGGI